ncbi:MAG: 50S ribosomal protein P1 [Candidatus Marsarchaeota archaeon]|jgi:large subunit ribosomal protein L12|nr:50S ribosomal protein P1 [Candidatus Marsarchaeota archaeon]
MEYIYAALLLDAAGKEIDEQSLNSVVKAAGVQPDEAMAKAVVKSLQGVNIKDVIKNAQAVQVAAPAVAAPGAKAEEKKEEKKEEKVSEEEAAGGLASLFG